MIDFSEADLFDYYDDISAFVDMQNKELGLYDVFGTPCLDIEAYKVMQEQGFLCTFVAHCDKALVGYAVYFLHKNFMYKNMLCAESHSFYLDKNYRKGFIGLDFLQYAEQRMQAKGVRFIFQRVQKKKNISAIFKRMQYKELEKTYIKEFI